MTRIEKLLAYVDDTLFKARLAESAAHRQWVDGKVMKAHYTAAHRRAESVAAHRQWVVRARQEMRAYKSQQDYGVKLWLDIAEAHRRLAELVEV